MSVNPLQLGESRERSQSADGDALVAEPGDDFQSTLAERTGVSQSRISRIERGDLDRAEIATVRSYV